MPQDPKQPFAPNIFHDYVADSIRTAPPPRPLPQADGVARLPEYQPIEINSENLRKVNTGPRQPFSYDISDPYFMAKRYMDPAWGSSGYVGPTSEQFNAERQSWGSKWANGVAKFIGNTATTAIAGTLGLMDGIMETGKSIFTPGGLDFSKIFDNPIDRSMQEYSNWQEYKFPNYQTDKERTAKWWSPDNWATANFWANGFLKNLGFAAGALLTGELGAAGLARVPAITEYALSARKLLATGRYRQVAQEIEAAMSTLGPVDDFTKASAIREIAMSSTKLQRMGVSAEEVASVYNFDNKFRNAFNRAAISTVGAWGESNMEGIQGIQSIRENLIEDYRKSHNGEMPNPSDMKEIEARAQEGANWRWFLNMLTLSVTNNIQFPRLLSNSTKNQMGNFSRGVNEVTAITKEGKIAGQIAKPTETYGETAAVRAAERNKAMKLINPVYQIVKNPVAVSEMVEEGLQYAYEKGTESYEQMQYDDRSASLFHEIVSTGMYKVFHDKEGIESMIFGGLTGKLMDAVLGGKERQAKKSNTQALLEALNSEKYTVAGDLFGAAKEEKYMREKGSPYINEQIASDIRHGAIANEHAKAVAKGDVERMQSLDADFIHNIAVPRILYGRKELFKQELRQYLSTNIPFVQSRQDLGLTEDITADDLDRAINKRIRQVDTIATLAEFVNGTFGVIDRKTGLPKYEQETLRSMLYSLFKISDQDDRYNKMIEEIEDETGEDMSPLTNYYARKRGLPKVEGEEAQDLDTVRTALHKKILQAVRNDPSKETDKNDINIFKKLEDLDTVMTDREMYVREYERLRNRTADKVASPIKSGDKASLEKLENYESVKQYPMLLKKMLNTVAARRIAVELSRSLESMDAGQRDKAMQHLQSVQQLMENKEAFLFKEDIQRVRDTLGRMKDKAFDQVKAAMPIADMPPGFDRMPREEALKYAKSEPDRADYLEEQEQPRPITEEQAAYLRQFVAEYNTAIAPLTGFEKTLDALESRGEPVTPKLSKIRRDIADSFMATYDEVEQAMSNKENDNYTDKTQIEDLIGDIEWMKSVYGQRPELLATPAFEGFMDLLDDRIDNLKEWLDIVNKRIANLLKDDTTFYRNKVTTQWNALGIDISKDIPEAAVTGTPSGLSAEDTKAMNEELATLEQQKQADIAKAMEPIPMELIPASHPDYTKALGGKEEIRSAATGEVMEVDRTIQTEQKKLEADYKIYEQLLKCS
jgi:hypothetical protein